MDNQKEILEVLIATKGELVKLRNDFLMLRVAVESIEKTVKKIENQNNDPFAGGPGINAL